MSLPFICLVYGIHTLLYLTLAILQLKDPEVKMIDLYSHELMPHLPVFEESRTIVPVEGVITIIGEYLPTTNQMWIESLNDRIRLFQFLKDHDILLNTMDEYDFKHENISEGKLFDRTSLKDMQDLYAWVKNHLGITSSDLCIIDEDYIRHKLVIDEPRFDYYAF